MTILYLCEKPSQARDIARVLNVHQRKDGYIEGHNIIVTWCIGHLLELAPPDHYCSDLKPWRLAALPVIPKEWVLFPVERTKAQFNIIKKLLKTAKTVIMATDPDREGEAIAREILDYCDYKGEVKRLWLNALDETSIKKALADLKPASFSEGLYQAAISRQRADWLVGLNYTMAATVLYGQDKQGVISVGRVQTPTLKLIVDRDLGIEHFKPQDYFTLKVQLTTAAEQSLWAHWQPAQECTDEEGRCIDKAKIEALTQALQGKIAVVESFEQRDKHTAPPLCLSLSALQKLASSLWGFSAKETLDIAQTLYEKYKATTYPRTDCGYLPESQKQEAAAILENLSQRDPALHTLIQRCDLHYCSPAWNDKKITAHHGIIPTYYRGFEIEELNQKEFQIYDLIRRYYIAQFLGDYQYQHGQVVLRCEQEIFMAQSYQPLVQGWKQALDKNDLDSKESDDLKVGTEEMGAQEAIPVLEIKENLRCTQVRMDSKKTKASARYTEGTLIAGMKAIAKQVADPAMKKVLNETAGLGTEATRANIIETLFKRNYVEKQGKYLISTQRGRSLIEKLPEAIKDPNTTALLEQALEEIAAGRGQMQEFLERQAQTLQTVLETLKS